MKNKEKYLWLLLLIPAVFLSWYMIAAKDSKPERFLPYYDADKKGESAEHTVPDFSFVDQHGNIYTQDSLIEKIYVTEFFFTTCQSICPVMNDNLRGIYADFREEPELHFLSHTVDPETDSVDVLKRYAIEHGVTDNRWHFVTGEASDIYQMARKGYFLDNSDPTPQAADDFVHTQNFALVDKEQKIRGYYDGTDSLEMVRLKQDIRVLLKEYDYREKISS